MRTIAALAAAALLAILGGSGQALAAHGGAGGGALQFSAPQHPLCSAYPEQCPDQGNAD